MASEALRAWEICVANREPCSQSKETGPPLLLKALSRSKVRPVGHESESTWPTRTDVWCWHCCHPFAEGPPLPMPVNYDDRRDVFTVAGTFCSWSCMKAYNCTSRAVMKAVTASIITLFRKRCTGKLEGVMSAPPRCMLKAFGGNMSIEQFRAAGSGTVAYVHMPPKMIVYKPGIEEVQVVSRKRKAEQNLRAPVDFKSSTSRNETLRLKRPTPLQSGKNLLERAMGINSFS